MLRLRLFRRMKLTLFFTLAALLTACTTEPPSGHYHSYFQPIGPDTTEIYYTLDFIEGNRVVAFRDQFPVDTGTVDPVARKFRHKGECGSGNWTYQRATYGYDAVNHLATPAKLYRIDTVCTEVAHFFGAKSFDMELMHLPKVEKSLPHLPHYCRSLFVFADSEQVWYDGAFWEEKTLLDELAGGKTLYPDLRTMFAIYPEHTVKPARLLEWIANLKAATERPVYLGFRTEKGELRMVFSDQLF